MIESLIPQVSTYAADIDNLFDLVFAIVAFWFVLSLGVFIYCIVKYRKKDGQKAFYVAGDVPAQTRWISWPHYVVILFDIVLVIGAIMVWYDVKQKLPPAQSQINVISQQWAWTFEQPGLDGKLGTADDIRTVDNLYIKKDTVYHYHLTTKDVLHNFAVPVFRLRQDAVPGRKITGWFKAIQTGTYDIQCAEMCGIAHGIMGAKIHILNESDYKAWMEKQMANPNQWAQSL